MAALRRRETYSADEPGPVELRETYISWVFLVADRAYKLKKPLVLPYLDYGTPDRRRRLCLEEVRLNRRLAPYIYIGVRGVALQADGTARLLDEQDPSAIDYLVEMRRYEERETLAAKLAANELEDAEIDAVAVTLARFHAEAKLISSPESPVLAAERRFERNAHELGTASRWRELLGRIIALENFAHAFLSAHGATLLDRAQRGCIREGHGDIRAEHVVFGELVQIVDCIEFDRGLREIDVADDLAFLVFDLVSRGAQPAADRLVESYRAAGGDPGDQALISFYAAYRALVRAKVALAAGHQREGTELIGAAESFAWRARRPLLIAVCGVPASGKSHLARILAERSGLPHLSSDATRKALAAVQPTERAPDSAYAPEFSARTYAALGDHGAGALRTSGGAIVDATFRHAADRRAFASALPSGAPVLFIECRAPVDVLAARAHARRQNQAQLSDADLSVVLREHTSFEALDEVDPRAHVALRTDRDEDEVLSDLLALLDLRLGFLSPPP